MASQAGVPDDRTVVLLLGEESARAPVAGALRGGELVCIEEELGRAAEMGRGRRWDVAVVVHRERGAVLDAAGALGGEGPVVALGPREALEVPGVYLAASAQEAGRLARALAGAGLRASLRALVSSFEAAFAAGAPEAWQRALARLAPAFEADRCSAVLLEGEGRVPTVVASSDAPYFRRVLPADRYPEVTEALRRGEPVLVADALQEPLLASARAHLAAADVRSLLAVPLACEGEILGALVARRRGRTAAFGAEALALGRAAAAALAAAAGASGRQRALESRGRDLAAAWEGRVRDLEGAQRRARAGHQAKDRAIAVFAHDVRGPLNILMGHARLLADADLDKPERASVEAILRQAKKLLELSEVLVGQGRDEPGGAALELAELDLATACRELVAENEIRGAERGVSLEVVAPPRLPLRADRLKLRQALQALLAHAIGRAREGGHVRVEVSTLARPDGELAQIVVLDDGPCQPEELPALFERYRSGARPDEGLASCRALVEGHGGEVWAEPGAEGGCAVTVTLPGIGARPPGEAQRPAAEKPRVLLVEDEPDIAAIAAEILRTRYQVDLVGDGGQALAAARTLHPDVILMDVFLPNVDGLDATASLKASPDTCDIPVILLSAHQGLAEKVRALRLGAVDYLPKPFDAKALLARVAASLAQRAPPAAPAEDLDPATGLLDRTGFVRRVAQEASRARRYGRALTLVGFSPERCADAGGVGLAAGALHQGVRSGDILAHLGDGRFVACLPDVPLAAAAQACERLADAIRLAVGAPVRVRRTDALAGPLEELIERVLRESSAA